MDITIIPKILFEIIYILCCEIEINIFILDQALV